VALAMALESACIPLPSEIIMPLAGWFLVQTPGLGWPGTLLAGLIGALGCTLGSALAYTVGVRGGRPFILRYGPSVLLSPHHLALAERWFGRYGEATTFVARLLPVVRTFISFPAGIARMPFAKFLIYTFAGSFLWCWALADIGFMLGARWTVVREALRPPDYPLLAVGVILVAWFVWRGARRDTTDEGER
jgi:membrane protein DedA with SNARE-associated domain